jgi:DNA gyrase/topoisomerase IV subunit B
MSSRSLKEGAHGGTMGSPMLDQVEPRREFIEQNAKDVRFLDV